MKLLKIFRSIVLVVLASVSTLTFPAAPISAVAEISLSPAKGVVGDSVTIQSSGLRRTPGQRVFFFFSNVKATVGEDIEANVGVYAMVLEKVIQEDRTVHNAFFNIPAELTDGAHTATVTPGYCYLYAVYETAVGEGVPGTEIAAVATFVVRGVTLDKAEGIVGTGVEMQGYGFTPLTNIDIEFGNTAIDITGGDIQTDLLGDFRATKFSIPESYAGARAITVTVGADEAVALFTVKPALTIDKTSAVPGDSLTASGRGFAKSSDITLKLGDAGGASASTDEDGSFTQVFEVPAISAGTFFLTAKDEDGNLAGTELILGVATTVVLTPTISPSSPGYVGMDVTVNGAGFRPEALIAVTYGNPPVAVANTSSDADGSFTVAFKVPQSPSGESIITASDGSKTAEIPFYMENMPPLVPVLSLPETDARVAATPLFTWQDVSDPSGITYDLQVSPDRDFGAATILLEKIKLGRPAYIPAIDEKLPDYKGRPYYWRVRAVDGASNASAWSTPGTFYVGSTPSFPVWAIYFPIGVAVLVLLWFVIRWLRRRAQRYL